VVFSLAFYMSVEENGIKHFLVSVTPEKHKRYVASITDRIKDSMGKWLLGQLLLMLIIAVTVWLGLLLVGVPHALLLGVFAGIMEIIPYVGPIIGAVPGVILGFIASPTIGFFAILVYVATQQLENHVIVPQVMKKAVGLSPITVILVLLIGAKLAGAMGAILAVPIAAAVSIFVKDLRQGKEI
jgi:predicted PurR-regulated permease PerM